MRHVRISDAAVPGLDVAVFEALERCLVRVDLVDHAPECEELGAADLFVGSEVGNCFGRDAIGRRVSGWEAVGAWLLVGRLDLDGAVEGVEEVERADVLVFRPALDEPFHAVHPGFSG